MGVVNLYTKNNCVQCSMTKKKMISLNIKFLEINIENDDELISQLKAEGFLQMPIVKNGLETFSGFRPDKIDELGKSA